MVSVRQKLHQWLLFPFLLPVFFVLYRARLFYGVAGVGDVLQLMGIYLVMSAVLFGIFRPVAGFALRAAVAASLLMICFLFWGEITTAVSKRVPGFTLVHLPWVVLGMLLIVAGCWLGLKKAGPHNRGRITFFLNVLFVIYICVELARLGWASTHRPPAPAFTRNGYEQAAGTIRQQSRLNVYLLLFDEYASSTSLRQDWRFDNSELDSFLLHQGFSVQRRSRANYNLTQFSMASLLNMDYLETLSPDGKIDPADYRSAAGWIDESRVVRDFGRGGYGFENHSIFRVAGQPEAGLPEFVHLDGKKLIAANTFAEVFRKEYWPFLAQRRKGKVNWQPGGDSATLFSYAAYNLRLQDTLLRTAASTGGEPKFIYAHFVLPHLPFLYDSLGRYLTADTVRAADTRLDPAYYGYNVRQANRIIRQVLDSILQHQGDRAVILLLGDHGFRKELAGNRAALFTNLNAVYFPDRDYRLLRDSMSNVNLFRVVLNKLFGTQYGWLPDRSLFVENR